jgi:outer membrane protein TolC
MRTVSGPFRAPASLLTAAIFALAFLPARFASAQHPYRIIYPGQRQIEYRDPAAFPAIPLPPSSPPPTVSEPPTGDTRYLALDDAIQTSLGNARVVRVLAGLSAVNSGRTIYDPAITNTTIDQAQGRFDPTIRISNNWDHIDEPLRGFVDPVNGNRIIGSSREQYRMDMALAKDNPLGGRWELGVNVNDQRFPQSVIPPSLLNPQTSANTSLGYTQPLLQGAGLRANLAPVVLARINTEISFFQLKDAVQQNVRDVISGYWSLVSARATVIARELQVNSLQFQYQRLDAQRRVGLGNLADAAQAHVSLAQFKAQRIAAVTDVLQREAALRNLLGLPPWDEARIVPTTEPVPERVKPEWHELVDLASARRPDLVELKLILAADEQQRRIANNNALPQLDGAALYRWNGLSGELPSGNGIVASQGGQFTDWTLGVNFSVPLGMRSARAQLRQRELLIARDRANLDQGLFAASHELATTLRSLDQAYEQYLTFTEAREAAQENRGQQEKEYEFGRTIFLNYLLAVTDLGNAIIGQAQALAQYNTFLADLELQTGTILETHGIRFYEERYGSIGPLSHVALYPQATPPTPNANRYPLGEQPAEQFFHLPDPSQFRVTPRRTEDLPPVIRPQDLPPPAGIR